MEQQQPQDARLVALTQGMIVTVDASDYERLNQWEWHAHLDGRTFYAEWNARIDGGKQKMAMMHTRRWLALFGTKDNKHLGLFATPEEAAIATAAAMTRQ